MAFFVDFKHPLYYNYLIEINHYLDTLMRLNIVSAGVVSLEGKPSEKDKINQVSKSFGEFADIDFCVDESNEDETVIVGTYSAQINTIEEIRALWSRFKKENK